MTRAPRNCFQPGWRCGVFSALSQAPSACWALRSQRAHVCSRASRFGRALRFCSARRGLGSAPGPRSLGEMRAGIAAADIAARTKALHAQLQRRCVGRTDPIAPCNDDGAKLKRAASQSDRGAQAMARALVWRGFAGDQCWRALRAIPQSGGSLKSRSTQSCNVSAARAM